MLSLLEHRIKLQNLKQMSVIVVIQRHSGVFTVVVIALVLVHVHALADVVAAVLVTVLVLVIAHVLVEQVQLKLQEKSLLLKS